METKDVVSIETIGNIALISLNNPPVNAASQTLRYGLQNAILAANTDGAVQVIAIYGVGRTFVAGADIKEFGKLPLEPTLSNLINQIEESAKPVITILHGTTLGGGLEIALGAHVRIGIRGLRVGLPEINLGLLPGAGGTQRAPRLIGIAAALDIILTGRHVPADEALNLGLIDRLSNETPRDAAIAAAKDVLSGLLTPRRTGQIIVAPDQAYLDKVEENLMKTHAHLISPHKCVTAVRASSLELKEGLKVEQRTFKESMDTPQRAGLIHAFFGERAVSKIPEAKIKPRDFDHIGIVGGGTMGSGIASTCLLSGLKVTLVEASQEPLAVGLTTIQKNLEGAVKRGKLSKDKLDSTLNSLKTSTDLVSLDQVDIVIEAVFEDMDLKKAIFLKLDKICKDGAILASNTSYLDVNELAEITSRPHDVIGLHFFSPAHVMRLIEVIVGHKTSETVTSTGFALAKRLQKVAVKSGVCDGFIGNRILTHYQKTIAYLVLDGASPQEVDQALEAFGFAMGPHKVTDLAGLDIGWMTRKRKALTRPKEERYSGEVADRICENGWFGRKSGKGYYLYGKTNVIPNPDVNAIIEAERKKAGLTPKVFTASEIVDRYMAAMISEATRTLEDKISARPLDIDMVLLFGYGFPRHRGGPMHYADTIGIATLVERIEKYAQEDSFHWRVPTLLRDMAESGKIFADLNR